MPHDHPVLKNGERLFAGQWLKSANGLFHAMMQEDGNLVIYRGDMFQTKAAGYEGTALWSLYPAGQAPGGGTGYHLYMQTDGNLCIYRQDPHAVTWVCHETAVRRAEDGRFLNLRDDGELGINQIWAACGREGYGEWEFDRIVYVLDPPPKITALNPPSSSFSMKGHNQSSLEELETFTMSYTKTTSRSYKLTTNLKISAKSKTTIQVPFIGQETIELTTEVSQGFEWNKTDQESHQESISVQLRVPAGKTYQAKCTWNTSSFNLPYVAIGLVKFDGYPEKLPVHLTGVFEGVGTHDVETFWKDVSPAGGAASPSIAGVPSVQMDDEGWHGIDDPR